MKSCVMLSAFAAVFVVLNANAAGWLDTSISQVNPVTNEKSELKEAQESFFDEEAHCVTDFWFPIRVGLGGSKHSTTNNVISIPWVWSNVYGAQVELISCAADVYGVQLCGAGVGNDVYGLQLSLGNYVFGDMYGLQFGGVFSVTKYVHGLQFDIVSSMADNMGGLQISGLSSGVRNSASGVQIGLLVNSARTMDGLQLGLINIAEKGKVVQIGLWNVYGEKEDSRQMCPIVNVCWE